MRLRKYLDRNGLTQTKFAESLDVSGVYFNKIVNGKRTPSKKLALKIEQMTGGKVRLRELLFPSTHTP